MTRQHRSAAQCASQLFGITATLVCLLALGTESAEAQYFGRNKVQHKDFEFEVLKTEHFDVYFYPVEREAAEQVARMAERWYTRLSGLLDHTLDGRQPVILYASHPDFEQTNVVQGAIGEGTGGVTEGLKRRVVLPLAATLAETDHVLGHELVHAFQYDIALSNADARGLSVMGQLPLWFVEGMAEYLSIGPIDPHTAMWIRDASRLEAETEKTSLPDIKKLDDPSIFPYRWGQALWAYVAGRWGDAVVGQIFGRALELGSATGAIDETTGLTTEELSDQWHEAIRTHYEPVLKATRPASTYGRALSGDTTDRDRPMGVSPVLSPDGRQIVYFSERSLLSVDLYLADVESGRVIRRLVHTAADPHFTSLQFISSAGSWHPGGKQFVLGAVRDGAPALAVLDVENGGRVREVNLPSLGEVLNPSWSPDGRSIAFSATSGGFTDLYIYDLETDQLRQLTNDAFADLQPSWAPDGRRLAFVTDRFSTDLTALDSGSYALAQLDSMTGQIDRVLTVDRGKSINPQWAPDGRRLYFLSDRTGVTNIYVTDVTTGRVNQVTNLDAGASGITALSPALSSPLDANRIAFSAYMHGQLDIYIIDEPQVLAGSPLAEAADTVRADALPPETRATTTLAALLEDQATGLPPETPAPEPYKSGLSLDYVGQPHVSAGVGAFGPSVGGGLSFMWSDMLGHHNLFAGIDLNTYGSGFDDLAKNTGGVLAYQNLKNRWNWGLNVQQAPYVTGGFGSGFVNVGGQLGFAEQTIIQRQTYRAAGGAIAYPFSPTTRVELGGGFNQLTFDQKIRTRLFDARTGQLISDETVSEELAAPLTFGNSSVAIVNDSSVFGATSPIAGQRARFEVAPTFGDLTFTSATADYRRYFMPIDFVTIAGRALHVGRYGSSAEDSRLLPLFLGYPELLRGYSVGSFSAEECTQSEVSSCEEFDRLLGSRMLIGNLELRVPLLRPFGVRSGMYGPVPVEVALFTDAGVAWNSGERPSLFGGDRQGVASAGVTFRINVFGYLILQADLAKPFQRQDRGWVWSFGLMPGF